MAHDVAQLSTHMFGQVQGKAANDTKLRFVTEGTNKLNSLQKIARISHYTHTIKAWEVLPE